MIFPSAPNHTFSEQDDDDTIEVDTEVEKNTNESLETNTVATETEVLNLKTIEAESQTEFDVKDLPATIDPEEIDSNTTTTNDDARGLWL